MREEGFHGHLSFHKLYTVTSRRNALENSLSNLTTSVERKKVAFELNLTIIQRLGKREAFSNKLKLNVTEKHGKRRQPLTNLDWVNIISNDNESNEIHQLFREVTLKLNLNTI
ncbi:hypothetical protein E2C01_088914 [Portunus trituberculatus]|uniref:Uncharacterized protein n=1 Tax=Portunus trituberculatus TaxID=210409 RepID=A0A5B7JHC4_PORTR|nr:hypothetical protein [Portunus trituberculatus]